MKQYQSGATLIVALVLLAIVTLLGAAGIRSTSLEMKMIASSRDRAMAFEAAESTLRQIELNLLGGPFSIPEIKSNFTSTCRTSASDEKKGSYGCFGGTFDLTDPFKTCEILSPDQEAPDYWNQKDNWENAGELAIEVAEDRDAIKTKYMVEFMCFAIKDENLLGTIDDKEAGDEKLIYMPLFRVTAIAQGLGGRAQAMTQAMVRTGIKKEGVL